MKQVGRKHRLGKILLGAGTAAALVLGSGVLAAPPAGASTQCNQNTSCYWYARDYQGTPWVAPTCGVWWFNSAVLSMKNYGHGTVYLYDQDGYFIIAVPVGSVDHDLGRGAYEAEINC